MAVAGHRWCDRSPCGTVGTAALSRTCRCLSAIVFYRFEPSLPPFRKRGVTRRRVSPTWIAETRSLEDGSTSEHRPVRATLPGGDGGGGGREGGKKILILRKKHSKIFYWKLSSYLTSRTSYVAFYSVIKSRRHSSLTVTRISRLISSARRVNATGWT